MENITYTGTSPSNALLDLNTSHFHFLLVHVLFFVFFSKCNILSVQAGSLSDISLSGPKKVRICFVSTSGVIVLLQEVRWNGPITFSHFLDQSSETMPLVITSLRQISRTALLLSAMTLPSPCFKHNPIFIPSHPTYFLILCTTVLICLMPVTDIFFCLVVT